MKELQRLAMHNIENMLTQDKNIAIAYNPNKPLEVVKIELKMDSQSNDFHQ
jgi:hypothetical protein